MSFQTAIRNAITGTGNGALSLLPDGAQSVKYVHLPEDFDNSKSWLVYYFSITENVSSMNNSCAYNNYQLTVIATTNDSMKTNDLSDALIDYLDGYSFGSIADITFESDSRSSYLETANNVYQNTMTFNVIYVP